MKFRRVPKISPLWQQTPENFEVTIKPILAASCGVFPLKDFTDFIPASCGE
jgi:hypothetical protein